jgi:uncharacterized protein (UPF0303 family)
MAGNMSLDDDLARIALQEKTLQFERFDARTAWEIGTRLKALAEARGAAVAIDITVNGRTIFFYAFQGTTPDNAEWVRRKKNVVQRFFRSSYGLGLSLERSQTSLSTQQGLELRDFSTHGGSFPINLVGTGCIGAITVSGLPQRQDHAYVVEVLAGYLGHALDELALA